MWGECGLPLLPLQFPFASSNFFTYHRLFFCAVNCPSAPFKCHSVTQNVLLLRQISFYIAKCPSAQWNVLLFLPSDIKCPSALANWHFVCQMSSSAANWHSALLYVKCPSAPSNDLLCNQMSFGTVKCPPALSKELLWCRMSFSGARCCSMP